MTATEQLDIIKESILKVMREQEKGLMKCREGKEKRGLCSNRSDKDIAYWCDKLHGQIDICDSLGIDRSEFNWIFTL